MMKIIGIVMIAISSFLIGSLYYLNIKSRPKELEFFIKLLNDYSVELKWQQKSLGELISSFSYKEYKEYITLVSELLQKETVSDSFINKNELFSRFHLNTDDKRILKSFFDQTGFSGLDTEINLVEKTIAALETLKQEADAKFKKLGPFSIKISIVCGIWIIILLF